MTPALREFAFIADGERGALVGPSGEIAWMCMPTWESEAVFTALLGGRGACVVRPQERFVWGGYYEPGTLIWRSRWVLAGGAIVECREALAFPGNPDRAVLMRRICPQKGAAKILVRLDLWKSCGIKRFENVKRSDSGVWTADSEGLFARWSGGADAGFQEETGLTMELDVQEGREHDLVLEFSTKSFDEPPQDAEKLWKSTENAWSRSMPRRLRCEADRDVRHAYAVLRGLTSTSGGMVAAATTSLPERVESTRDYDYRYVWIRDQCWVGQAIAIGGPDDMLTDAVRFVKERVLADGDQLHPAYTTSGKPVPSPRRIDHLPGYPGTIKVVAGNKAGSQFQLDVFGEALLLFAAAAKHDSLDAEGWKAAETAAEAISRRWREKDSGVWEMEERQWTHSKLMCAAGLRQISRRGAPLRLASRWLSLADSILGETGRTGLHDSGRWKRAEDDDRVDAALLLPSLRGATDPEDPRSLATLQEIEQHLLQEGYCHRFRTGLPLGENEGAFSVCNFWLALTHFQLGNSARAIHLYERARSGCGPPGLFTEEYDVIQRELRGNFPQAFVHALLLECASRMGDHLEHLSGPGS